MRPTIGMVAASAVVVLMSSATVVETFTPVVHYSQGSRALATSRSKRQVPHDVSLSAAAAATKSSSSTQIPNPFKALPWNARREKEREARRIKKESAKLHRELGIAEDASFEEINEATDALLARVAGDMKAKIKIEVAKDRILQMRLNERLAGLARETVESRARTEYEKGRGDDDDDEMISRRESGDDDAPTKSWLSRIIVKPDPQWRNQQLRVYGILSAVCLQLPAFGDLGIFMTGIFCCGQLVSRGQPKTGASVNPMFGRRRSMPHQRTAFVMAFVVWVFARVLAFSVVKTSTRLKDSLIAPGVEVAIMSAIAGLTNAYVQLYDPKASPGVPDYDDD